MRTRLLGPIVIAALVIVSALAVLLIARDVRGDCDHPVSASRTWNDQLLDAIRRDFPAPTVHARNLYHLSAAHWDVWAAYDPSVSGVFLDLDRSAVEPDDARSIAISYASHRLLTHRYANSVGAEASLAAFDATLEAVCLDPIDDPSDLDPADPAAVGLAVAEEIITSTRDDGSLEASNYVDLSYAPVNPPLVVNRSGTSMVDPNRWQPLSLDEQITQNGQVLPGAVQEAIGPNWGRVVPFALDHDPVDGLPFDPGPPPLWGVDPAQDAEFADAAAEVVLLSGDLDPESTATIDLSPAARGHEVNPVLGTPYEPNEMLLADYGRVIAEYWADGPDSETPPGHWNTLAHAVTDTLVASGIELRLGGDGPALGRLEWDVKLHLALNGAMHDAAIAAWGTKNHEDYARPISMIRYLGERALLPETPGRIETITAESSALGERHADLADHLGEQAVWAWRGQPDDPDTVVSGVGWIAAVDWVPYQRASFVSPAFPAYVSGHSTFSRAGAEVLEFVTGSAYFPGGLATWVVEPGGLIHELGPTETVTLTWATYRDAADEAGISRRYGGIHVEADDVVGREMGADIGRLAWERASSIFAGG